MEDAMREGRIHMDCAQFKEVIRELDRPSIEVELTEEALIHAECCDSCAVLLTETESLDFALRRIAEEAVESAPPRVEAALLQEFRRAQETRARKRMQWQILAFGVAAALLLAAGLALRYRATPTRGIETAMQVGAGPSQMSESPAQNVPSSAEPEQAGSTQPGDATVTGNADIGATEVAQEFTPLPYADDPSMIDGGTVVRVIMSRSALASFGVLLTGVESRDRIPADLVVSADGTPEAIRLVAENVN
jgi:hypothetical protein